ncbi:MAG: hypothetical protein J6A95_06190 [Clostridia bacterium]|nr:hypothetical protein [Clostridia bacterium]
MNGQFNTILSIALIPQIIDLIIKNEEIEDTVAIEQFYKSKTYKLLADEKTKVWHYSPLTIYHMWKTEKENGEIIFPEG